MSILRFLTQKFSTLSTIKSTNLKLEVHIYLHSFHTLPFWEKLHTLEVTVETWESFGGALDYTHKMTNLKTFKIITGTKFSENAVKKPHFSLAIE